MEKIALSPSLFILGLFFVFAACKEKESDCGLPHCKALGTFQTNITIDRSSTGETNTYDRNAIIPVYIENDSLRFEEYLFPIEDPNQKDFQLMNGKIRLNFLDNFNRLIAVVDTSEGGPYGGDVVYGGDRTGKSVSLIPNDFHKGLEGDYNVTIRMDSTLNYGNYHTQDTSLNISLSFEEDRIVFGDTSMRYDKPFHSTLIDGFFNLEADTVRHEKYFAITAPTIIMRWWHGVLNEEGSIIGVRHTITAFR